MKVRFFRILSIGLCFGQRFKQLNVLILYLYHQVKRYFVLFSLNYVKYRFQKRKKTKRNIDIFFHGQGFTVRGAITISRQTLFNVQGKYDSWCLHFKMDDSQMYFVLFHLWQLTNISIAIPLHLFCYPHTNHSNPKPLDFNEDGIAKDLSQSSKPRVTVTRSFTVHSLLWHNGVIMR